jgi:hypothetical protein
VAFRTDRKSNAISIGCDVLAASGIHWTAQLANNLVASAWQRHCALGSQVPRAAVVAGNKLLFTIAFRLFQNISAPNLSYAAQYLA